MCVELTGLVQVAYTGVVFGAILGELFSLRSEIS